MSGMPMSGMPPALAFVLLLATLLAWLAVPLVPALVELLRPQDAAPLDAVGNDTGNLTFFAESFTARAAREGLLGTIVPPRLTDGTEVRIHSQAQPLTGRKTIDELVVFMDTEAVPPGTTFTSECLARLTLRGSENVTYRALLGQRDVILGPRSTVLRWVHARGRLEVADGSRLLGRATAERLIVLAPGVLFDRLDCETVRVTGQAAIEPMERPSGAYRPFEPSNATLLGARYWRTTEDVLVPSDAALVGSIVSTGAIVVDRGARVTGSLKAHRDLRVAAGAVVNGSIAARGRVVIEQGAKVTGPVIAEQSIEVWSATIGGPMARTTLTAPVIHLHSGATIYGAVMATDEGRTLT